MMELILTVMVTVIFVVGAATGLYVIFDIFRKNDPMSH